MRPREASRELRYIRYQSINQIRSDSNGELSVQIRFGSQSDLIDLTAALALAEVHGVTWRARGINPAHFIIHFFFFIPYGLMASQKASDLAVNAYDDSCIIVANSRREQPADNTCRPIKASDSSRGYRFRPLKLPIRAPKITALPQ